MATRYFDGLFRTLSYFALLGNVNSFVLKACLDAIGSLTLWVSQFIWFISSCELTEGRSPDFAISALMKLSSVR